MLEGIGHLAGSLLAHASAFFEGQGRDGTPDFVEFAEELQRLLAHHGRSPKEN